MTSKAWGWLAGLRTGTFYTWSPACVVNINLYVALYVICMDSSLQNEIDWAYCRCIAGWLGCVKKQEKPRYFLGRPRDTLHEWHHLLPGLLPETRLVMEWLHYLLSARLECPTIKGSKEYVDELHHFNNHDGPKGFQYDAAMDRKYWLVSIKIHRHLKWSVFNGMQEGIVCLFILSMSVQSRVEQLQGPASRIEQIILKFNTCHECHNTSACGFHLCMYITRIKCI